MGAVARGRTDDKKRGRLHVISHLRGRIPYESPARKEVALPERVIHDDTGYGTVEPRHIPTPF